MNSVLNQGTIATLRAFDVPGKSDFFTEVIGTYLSDTGQRMITLKATHDSGDFEGLAKTAHAIKGSSLNVGADGLAALMHTLEHSLKPGSDESSAFLTEAQALYQRVRAELAALI